MFDLSVSLGSLLTIASFIVVVTVYIVTGRSSTRVLDTRLEMIDAQMEDFKTEIKKLSEVLVAQATMTGNLNRVEDRQLAQGKRLDELAREFNEWISVNGVYGQRHRLVEDRIKALESICNRLPRAS